jgi:autotransporter-associated beta strand protein
MLAGSGTMIGNIAMGSGVLSPGSGANIGRLAFANDLSLQGNIANLKISNGTNDTVAVGGNLILSGTTTINIAPPAGFSLLPNSTNVLFSWGGALTGDLNNLQLSYPAQSATAVINLITNLTTRQISLIIVSNKGNQVVWKGNSGNNLWDRATANWLNGAATVIFTNLDDVTFNDSGIASVPVTLADTVTPASIVVSNNNNAYTFNGGGQISGVTTLTKNGTNTLTVLQDNSFSGAVTVNAGTVVIGSGSGAGSLGSGTLVNNSTVVFNRDTTLTISAPFQGSGTIVQNSTNGTMILTADSSNPGNMWVEAGTLQLGSGNAGSINGSITGIITNNATLTYIYDSSRTIPNSLAGNGVVNYNEVSGNRLYTFPLTVTNYGFNGTMNIAIGVSVHADNQNLGGQFGNGATVNVPFLGQAWMDSLATNAVTSNYNSAFLIQGPGWSGDPLPIGHVSGDTVGLGALRLFNSTLTGPITLLGDTRIGSSSSGGTIQGQISDGGNNYELEIVTSSANLDNAQTFAPTGGPNPFGRLLVTSGTVQAGSTNAFTNAVTMAAWGRMRLNGYNLTIASLSGGTPVGTTNCYVYNYNRTNPATLTVGTDGSSQQFDGIFADGTNQPLGVAKVGPGTWTLTANSTNTGAVSVKNGVLALNGSGSFSNSTLLSVSSGATLDVNSRIDGTLTLNGGQTLAGSGTVSGKINALAGSTVSPGNSIGTLNVSSDLTLAGTLLMELNRTNGVQTNDLINVSGLFTTTAGTLAVSNTGPVLAVGNFFQLFSGGRSFASVILQTNDTVNNVKYTWNNTVGSNGRISVAGVASLVNTNSPHMMISQSGNVLNLAWPTNLGWTLLTNSAGLAASNQWFPYSGSALVTNVSINMDSTKTNVFFRMVYPYP